MVSNLISNIKVSCRSLLIDLKGTRSKTEQSIDDAVKALSKFYQICESFYAWKARKYGEFICLTFSDSCYVEIYGDTPSTLEIIKDADKLIGKLESENLSPRVFISKGYSFRRRTNLLRKAHAVFHIFGLGDAMIKVFDAEKSHFEGTLFVESSLWHNSMEPEFKPLGKFYTYNNSVEFIRLR